MTGGRLMNGDPAKVAYRFTLFERGTGANHPRIQTDSVDRPLAINVGTKLELRSTAKVRTLITYLAILARLYEDQRRRPEERREGKAGVSTCRSLWSPDHY